MNKITPSFHQIENSVAKTEGDEEESKGDDMEGVKEQRAGTSTLDEFVHKPAENLAQKLQVKCKKYQYFFIVWPFFFFSLSPLFIF